MIIILNTFGLDIASHSRIFHLKNLISQYIYVVMSISVAQSLFTEETEQYTWNRISYCYFCFTTRLFYLLKSLKVTEIR